MYIIIILHWYLHTIFVIHLYVFKNILNWVYDGIDCKLYLCHLQNTNLYNPKLLHTLEQGIDINSVEDLSEDTAHDMLHCPYFVAFGSENIDSIQKKYEDNTFEYEKYEDILGGFVVPQTLLMTYMIDTLPLNDFKIPRGHIVSIQHFFENCDIEKQILYNFVDRDDNDVNIINTIINTTTNTQNSQHKNNSIVMNSDIVPNIIDEFPNAIHRDKMHFPNKVLLIDVLGMGCQLSSMKDIENAESHYKNLIQTYGSFNEKDIKVMVTCNPSIMQQISNVSVTLLWKKPSKAKKYIEDLYDIVTHALKDNYYVLLTGHSYGGSVVSRICELLNRDTQFRTFEKIPNISAATFGSIYIPEKSRVSRVELMHYIISGDIVAKCNKLTCKKSAKSSKYTIDHTMNNKISNIPEYIEIIDIAKDKKGTSNLLKILPDMIKSKILNIPLKTERLTFKKRWEKHNQYSPIMDIYIQSKILELSS